MPERTPPRKQPSDGVTYALVLLILALAFGLQALPDASAGEVTLTRATLTPAPTASPTSPPTSTPAPTALPTAAPTPAAEPSAAPNSPAPTAAVYVLNTNTLRFHKPDCSSVGRIKEQNRGSFTGTREELIEQGYVPCGNCDP